MRINIVSEQDLNLWNAIVDASQHGTIFHRWEWLKIVEKHSKSKLHPLIGFEGNEPVGILPLFYSRRWLLRMVFSPPLGAAIPTLGPILLNYDEIKPHKMEHIYREFQKQVDHFINSELHPDYVSITTSPGLLDVRPFIWSGYRVTPYYTYKIDLTTGEAAVWDSFKKKLRSDIKRAEPKGIIVREGTIEDIQYLFHSLKERYYMQNIGSLISIEYLYDLFKEFGSRNLWISVALYNNQTVGAIFLITYKETTAIWLGVAKSGLAGLPTNDLIQWEAIRWSIKNGCKAFELIGANTWKLCEFKSKYSPHLEVYFNAQKSNLLGKLGEQAYLKLFKKSSGPKA
ncbi:hypothetical protein ES703_44313 [subsurface metagenome]